MLWKLLLVFALGILVDRSFTNVAHTWSALQGVLVDGVSTADADALENGAKARRQHSRSRLTLPEIARSHDEYPCSEGLVYVNDTIAPDFFTNKGAQGRNIPKVIHMTAKSRCMTPAFANNVEKWRFPGYSLFVHDDDAVDRFINQDFPLFPHFRNVWSCVNSGAARADLWRYLMIWEHGGIYTDFDNTPIFTGLQDGKAISPLDDAWFPIEGLGVVAQFLFAASPQHPVMYLSLESGLHAIWNSVSIDNDKAPYTTGPRATKNGVIQFLQAVGIDTDGYLPAGIYFGMGNRSITIVGDKTRPHEFVNRGGVPNKRDEYLKMGMTHFAVSRGNYSHSCTHHIHYNHVKKNGQPPILLHNTMADNALVGRDGIILADPTIPPPMIDCGCKETCTQSILNQRLSGAPFTCIARIEFLMAKYGSTVAEACASTVQNHICGKECDPSQCHR